ncbi:MAG: DEAD/DEAH box helicase, partial [Synechococcales cyanobacterium SupBloom_Metag_052]|nr:DEAD/DEAH box helicase [Synechococcales cyanobacterium SupBloom_Metag_052]
MQADRLKSADGPLASQGAPWVQVWVEAGREGQVFTYANPDGLALASGDLVRVPLRGRRHVGLVVETLQVRPGGLEGVTLVAIEALHQRAAVDGQWHGLIEDVARDCHTSLFRTLKSALPPGWLGQRPAKAAAAPRSRVWLALAGDGARASTSGLSLSAKQQALVDQLAGMGGGAWQAELLASGGCSRSVLDGLERRGLVRKEARVFQAADVAKGTSRLDLAPSQILTGAQAAALQQIRRAPAGQGLLLWGVTGAGKTEVYLQAAADCLAAGQGVLLLTPEIGLVPQLLDRCRQRFGAAVAEFHSGCSEGQRIETWRRCLEADGAPLVVVGTRSAVFLPISTLGLIVLDEEHDSSYKQDSPMPCYHARDVARHRARRSGARLV